MRTRTSPLPVLVIGTTLIATNSLADVAVNEWISNSVFHHRRTGVPDQDQKRVDLPNNGSCYCVPTSQMNLFMYIANHGYPTLDPGPGAWGGAATYDEATDQILDYAEIVGVGSGAGREKCGGSASSDEVKQWMAPVVDEFVVKKYTTTSEFAPSFLNIGKLANLGNVMTCAYGRYHQVGTEPGGSAIFRRSGGHSVTFNEIYKQVGTQWLRIRDPGDDGDLFTQSAYASSQWDILDLTFYVTTDEPGGPLLTWGLRTMPEIEPFVTDGVRQCIDSVTAIRPLSGFTFNGPNITDLPLTVGLGGAQINAGAAGGAIIDAALDAQGIGFVALVDSSTGVRLKRIDAVDGTVTEYATIGGAKRVCVGRHDDWYVLTGSTLTRFSSSGAQLDIVSLSPGLGAPRAATYNAADDEVLVLFEFGDIGGHLVKYPRDLDSAAPQVFVVLGAEIDPSTRIARDLGGGVWMNSESTNKAHRLTKQPFVNEYVPTATLTAGLLAPMSIDVDDSGRVFVASLSEVGPYVACFVPSSPTGPWTSIALDALQGFVPGSAFFVDHSSTNETEEHTTSLWDNVEDPEADQLGDVAFDCPGDLDNNGVVDGADLATLLGTWNQAGGSADLDLDGIVGGSDLAILLGAWGPCPKG